MTYLKKLHAVSRRFVPAVALCMLAAVPAASAADNAQKIGLVDINKVITQMPEKKSADQNMQAANVKANQEMKALQADFNAYMTQKAKTKKSNPAKEKSFPEREAQIRQELAGKEQEYYGPLQQKLRTAIESTAKKEGYSIVFDKNVAVYGDSGADLTYKVMDQLNIK